MVCLVLVGLGMAVLTTFIVLGDAPWFVSWVTMFSWPIKAATWIGVSPDCQRHRNMQLWSTGNCLLKQILPYFKMHMCFLFCFFLKTTAYLIEMLCIFTLLSNAWFLCMETHFCLGLKFKIRNKVTMWDVKLQMLRNTVAIVKYSVLQLREIITITRNKVTTARFKDTLPALWDFKWHYEKWSQIVSFKVIKQLQEIKSLFSHI